MQQKIIRFKTKYQVHIISNFKWIKHLNYKMKYTWHLKFNGKTNGGHLCRAPLNKECLQHHGHKEDLGLTSGTWGAIGEGNQMILVWMGAPSV